MKSESLRRDNSPAPRPICVTLLASVVFLFAGLHWLGLWQAVIYQMKPAHSLLPLLPITLWFRLVLFGVLAPAIAWGLWNGKTWSPKLLVGLLAGYFSVYWLEQLVFNRLSWHSSNLPFQAGFTIFSILVTCWILSKTSSRIYFGGKHERRKNRTTA